MKKQILASESFSSHKRHYFLDFKRAENNSNYIQITRSEQQEDATYRRWQVIVFEDDFPDFIQAFASLFQSVAWGDRGYAGLKEIQSEARTASGIKAMEPAERPREKLLSLGREKMSDMELLAMLIGSGTPNESALGLAGRILTSVDGDLHKLSKMSLPDFCRFSGMGIAKSSAIVSALELALRINKALPGETKVIYMLRKTGKGRENFFGYN